jgi:hypothetical protein
MSHLLKKKKEKKKKKTRYDAQGLFLSLSTELGFSSLFLN